MSRFLAVLLFAASSGGCRTQIAPYKKPEPKVVYVGERQCNVYDFESATDLPDGARNLGWVSVKKAETDEGTFLLLRQKVCEMGGDAISQVAWVREMDEYEPSTLKANAWVLP